MPGRYPPSKHQPLAFRGLTNSAWLPVSQKHQCQVRLVRSAAWERLSSQTSPWQLSTAWPWDSCCQLPRDAGWGTGGGISRIQMCQQAMLSRCEDTPGQTHSSSPTRDTARGGGWAEGRPKEKGMTLTAPPTVLRVPPLLTSLHE